MAYKPRLPRKQPKLIDKTTKLDGRGRPKRRLAVDTPLLKDLELDDMGNETQIEKKQQEFLDSIGVKADATEQERTRAVRRYKIAQMLVQGYSPEQICQKCGYAWNEVTADIKAILKGWKDEFEENRGTIRGRLSKKLNDDETQIRMLLDYALGDFTDEQVQAAEARGKKPRKVSLGTWAQLYDRILKIYDMQSKLFQLDDELLPAGPGIGDSYRKMAVYQFERLVPGHVPEGIEDGGKGEITPEQQEIIELSYMSEEQRDRRARLLAKQKQVEKSHTAKTQREIERDEQEARLVRDKDID